MASVRRFVIDAELFPVQVIAKHAAFEDIAKPLQFAALNIQRLWRGYVVRKEIARWNYAAIILQKYIRRWLVLWHLPRFYEEYLDWSNTKYYNEMATRVQSAWRGYMVRRDDVPVRDIIAQRRAVQEMNNSVVQQMQDAFKNLEMETMKQKDKEAQESVLYIIFKLRHLLRTYVQEGIYSLHNQKNLSPTEVILKALPSKNYMSDLRKQYYEDIGKEQPPPKYIFKTKTMQRMEDLYRYRDRSRELREVFTPDLNIHDEPFTLTPKVKEKLYERDLLTSDKYPPAKFSFTRPVEKSKHISGKDFDLHVNKKVVFPQNPPPYYIDHWAKSCDLHNIPE